jgi:hypothetical protein
MAGTSFLPGSGTPVMYLDGVLLTLSSSLLPALADNRNFRRKFRLIQKEAGDK